MPPASGLTIGQVSALLGVPVPTLRSWHLRYDIALPQRTAGGHRRYEQADVAVLQALATAVSRGIAPRAAARALCDGPGAPDVPSALLEALLEAAQTGRQELVGNVLSDAQRDLGLDATVERLLIPALHEIGRRWEVGLCDVGLEHLATTAARRWIAQQVTEVRDVRQAQPVLLAGAPGNEHTVALEAFELMLRRRGWLTCQLGANTPVPSMLSALHTTGAQAVVITAHQASRRRAAVDALATLRARTDVTLFFAGAAFDSERRRQHVAGVYLGTALAEAADLVARHLATAEGSNDSKTRLPRAGDQRSRGRSG